MNVMHRDPAGPSGPVQPSIEVHYVLEEIDIRRMHRRHTIQSLRRRRPVFFMVIGVSSALVIIALATGMPVATFFPAIGILLGFAALICVQILTQRKATNRLIRAQSSGPGARTLIANEAGVTIVAPNRTTFLNWCSFASIQQDGALIYLEIQSNLALLLPKRALEDSASADNIYRQLKSLHERSKQIPYLGDPPIQPAMGSTVIYQPNEADLLHGHAVFLKRSGYRAGNILAAVIAVVFTIGVGLASHWRAVTEHGEYTGLGLFVLIGATYSVALLRSVSMAALKRAYRKTAGVNPIVRIAVNPSVFAMESRIDSFHFDWSAIDRLDADDEYILVGTIGYRVVVIPRRAFATYQQSEAYLNLMRKFHAGDSVADDELSAATAAPKIEDATWPPAPRL